MIADEFLKAELAKPDIDAWYKRRVIVAHGLVMRARIMHLVQAEEVVSETIFRVLVMHNGHYLWDGRDPDTFNKFFSRAMSTTASYFASHGRGQIKGLQRYEVQVVLPTPYEVHQEAEQEAAYKNSSLAAAIVTRRMRGATAKYVDNLPHYVAVSATMHEIADDLNIKPDSVSTIRNRLRHRFGDDPEKG